MDILPTRTSVSPNIPAPLSTLLPLLPDLLAGQALIAAVVPLPYIFCDLDFCIRANIVVAVLAPLLPRKFVSAA